MALLAATALLTHIQLAATRTIRSLWVVLLFSVLCPKLSIPPGLPHPRRRIQHLPLLNFIQLVVAQSERILQRTARLRAPANWFSFYSSKIKMSSDHLPLINLLLELAPYTNRNLPSPSVVLSYVKVSASVFEWVFLFSEGEMLCLHTFLLPAHFGAKYWLSNIWFG